MNELISVIIVNWNGERYLHECLESVLAQNYQPLEIIVVDNGSGDRSVQIIRTDYPQVNVIEPGKNLGFAAGNNVGIRRAKGRYIVLLNNDAEMEGPCVSEMMRAINGNERYGACATRIRLKFEQGLLDAAGIVVCADGLSIGRGRLEPAERYNREEEVFFASGCCMMCRREMLEDVRIGEDYFDESFFMYADDTDLGWRAWLQGWKTIYAPDAVVHHLHSASSDNYSPLKAFLVERNRIWVQLTYFPLPTILRGVLFTAARYMFQAYGAFTGRGASGGFATSYSKTTLVRVLIEVWVGALRGLPSVWKKRRVVQKRRRIGRGEIGEALRLYGIKAREIGLKR